MRTFLNCAFVLLSVMTGAMTASASEALPDRCDIGVATTLGSFLGKVYCRGALAPEEYETLACPPETTQACQQAFTDMAAQRCPDANNPGLHDKLIAVCGVL